MPRALQKQHRNRKPSRAAERFAIIGSVPRLPRQSVWRRDYAAWRLIGRQPRVSFSQRFGSFCDRVRLQNLPRMDPLYQCAKPRRARAVLYLRVSTLTRLRLFVAVGSLKAIANASGPANRVRPRCSRIALCNGPLRCGQSALRHPPSTASFASSAMLWALIEAASPSAALRHRPRYSAPAYRGFSRAHERSRNPAVAR